MHMKYNGSSNASHAKTLNFPGEMKKGIKVIEFDWGEVPGKRTAEKAWRRKARPWEKRRENSPKIKNLRTPLEGGGRGTKIRVRTSAARTPAVAFNSFASGNGLEFRYWPSTLGVLLVSLLEPGAYFGQFGPVEDASACYDVDVRHWPWNHHRRVRVRIQYHLPCHLQHNDVVLTY